MKELTEDQQRLKNNVGTEICGYNIDDVKAVFESIMEEIIEEGRNNFM